MCGLSFLRDAVVRGSDEKRSREGSFYSCSLAGEKHTFFFLFFSAALTVASSRQTSVAG